MTISEFNPADIRIADIEAAIEFFTKYPAQFTFAEYHDVRMDYPHDAYCSLGAIGRAAAIRQKVVDGFFNNYREHCIIDMISNAVYNDLYENKIHPYWVNWQRSKQIPNKTTKPIENMMNVSDSHTVDEMIDILHDFVKWLEQHYGHLEAL